MTTDRRYPAVSAEQFSRPPRRFEDAAGREIEIATYSDGPIDDEEAALVSMYANFDTADRAQGLPPSSESDVREWLSVLLAADAVNVLAWHDEFVAGHAMLVPDDDRSHELAIFVHHQYQGAGIGSRLIDSLLGAGADRGIERVWLTVERWNAAARNLYRSVGFETTSAESFELEMSLALE